MPKANNQEMTLRKALLRSLPLKISHKEFVHELQGEERVKAWQTFINQYWQKKPHGTPSSKTEFLLRRGFFRNRWWLFDFAKNDVEEYLSDLQASLIKYVNGIYANVLNDRMLLIHALSAYCRVPQIYALRGFNATEIAFSEEWHAHYATPETASDLAVLVQPLFSESKGRVEHVKVSCGNYEGFGKQGTIDKLRMIVKDWSQSANSSYIFMEALQQGDFGNALYPQTANNLHVIMGRDHDTWEPHIISVILNIGTKQSEPYNRVEFGGLSAKVDAATGEIVGCLGIDNVDKPVLQNYAHHPNTGLPIMGVRIPDWQKHRETIIRIFDESSYLRLCAFNFLLLGDGLGLQGTSPIDLVAAQVHAPLLTDDVFANQLRKLKL